MAVKLIKPRRVGDERGWFAETYNDERYAAFGVDMVFRQDNHSMSRAAGVLRGLHFQLPPHAQAKLVRCVRGSIWDVAVDIRHSSPTYGQWAATVVTADDGMQVFVPIGFAHGFLTLEPNTEVEYKTSDLYAPDCEGGLLWNDADLAIAWPTTGGDPILSDKDRKLPRLANFSSQFTYDGTPLAALEPVP